jgi:hypothetical protein
MKAPIITLLVGCLALVAAAGDLGNRAPWKSNSTPAAHPPINPEATRQGGDTMADAFAIPEIPFDTTGTTTGYIDDYDEVCPYSDSTSPDVVYSITPAADILVDIDMLGSEYDTKIYVYDAELNLIACNDDFYPDYVSKLEQINLLGDALYFLVIDGWNGDSGNYVLTITEHELCVLECPPGGYPEGEPPLVDDYEDSYNGGCNSPEFGYPFQDLYGDENGELLFCGVSGWYQYQGTNYRDTDWFIVYAGDSGSVYVASDAERPTYLFFRPLDCSSTDYYPPFRFGACAPGDTTFAAAPGGVFWLFVGPTTFSAPDGSHPYEYDYVVHFSGLQPGTVVVETRNWSAVKGLFR